jgi:hypothetical protein
VVNREEDARGFGWDSLRAEESDPTSCEAEIGGMERRVEQQQLLHARGGNLETGLV